MVVGGELNATKFYSWDLRPAQFDLFPIAFWLVRRKAKHCYRLFHIQALF